MYDFPCDYPIKVFGPATEGFEQVVLKILTKHVGKILPEQIVKKNSQKKNYFSLTITIFAKSLEDVENIYKALKACPDVLMVL